MISPIVDSAPTATPSSWSRTGKMIQNEDLAGIPLLILINKLDAPDNIPLADLRQQFSITPSLVGDRPARITPMSAMTGCAKAMHDYVES